MPLFELDGKMPAGTVVGQRFLIEEQTGSGGMGAVFRALDRQTGRLVALKVLDSEAISPAKADRFLREAQLLAQLHHPGIVSYVTHGYAPTGQPFLVMEWLAGEDLAQRLGRGPLSLGDCLRLARATAAALAVAHERGIVHRDLKPSNLFLRDGALDCATLLDFGIARKVQRTAALTRTGTVIGTPAYMAPEQARGQPDVGPSADVFSLGCVLFEALAGQPPFVGDHVAAVLAKILFEEPPPLRNLRPEAPAELESLLVRMLAKAPESRPADGAALLAELAALGEPVDDADALRSPAWPPEQALADIEQHFVSIVVAGPSGPVDGAAATLASDELPERKERRRALVEALARLGARPEWLADGSLVATSMQAASATDQATQAARCALAVQEHWPEATVAVATGRGVWRQHVVVGQVIDRAVALLGARLPGVYLDQASAGLLDARFAVRRDLGGQLILEGERVSVDESRPLLGRPTPCVGREQELATLEAVFSTCVQESVARVVLVSAPPGMGKSRLRHEFVRRLSARHGDAAPQLFFGRGDLMSAGSPYDLVAQALRRQCGVVDGAPLAAQQERLRARVAQALPAGDVQRVAEFLGELCGMPFADEASPQLRAARRDPRLLSDQVGQAFVDFLRAEGRRHPLLMVLEDLHWGDVSTIKLIDQALRELPELPWMVLAFARPEVNELFPRLWSERLQEIRLGGLSRRACEQLIQQVLGGELEQAASRRIIEQAAGNALYLEELIRAAAEGRGDESPETVLAMLQARLHRLEPSARRLLRAASVFGDVFWHGGVLALNGQERLGREVVAAQLQTLIDAEVIERRRESRFSGQLEYAFRHTLVREAAYSLLTEADRALGHRLAAEYLVTAGEHDPMIVAEHYRRGSQPERAIPFYIRAAEQALAGNDLEGALSRAALGLGCGPVGEARGSLRGLESAAHFWRDQWLKGYDAASEALALLPRGSLPWCRTIAHQFVFTSVGLRKEQEFAELVGLFASVQPATETARAAYIEAAAWLVTMFTTLGQRAPAQGFLHLIDQAGAAMGHGDVISEARQQQAHMFYERMLGANPAQTLHFAQASSDAFRRAGDQRNLAFMDGYCGIALADLGQLADGEARLRQSLALAERLREVLTATNSQLYLALLLSRQPARADEALALASEILGRNPLADGVVHGVRAQALVWKDELAAAEAEARQACAMLQMMPTLRFAALAVLVRLLLSQQRGDEALALAESGHAEVTRDGGGYNEVSFRLAVAEARHARGDVAGAGAALRETLAAIDVRAQPLAERALREPFLTQVTENARAHALAQAWSLSPR